MFLNKCEECGKKGQVYEINAPEDIFHAYYCLCDRHAPKRGFCLGCGYFCGGLEDFEFGSGSKYGYCFDCWEALRVEIEGDYFDEDEDYYR